LKAQCTVNKTLRDSWICFDQTFLGRGMGILFPARESLVKDIPAGDGNPPNLYLQCGIWNLGPGHDVLALKSSLKSPKDGSHGRNIGQQSSEFFSM